MSDKIKKGDVVTVTYSNYGQLKNATVKYAPLNYGEWWVFDIGGGDILELNPNSSAVLDIFKEAE